MIIIIPTPFSLFPSSSSPSSSSSPPSSSSPLSLSPPSPPHFLRNPQLAAGNLHCYGSLFLRHTCRNLPSVRPLTTLFPCPPASSPMRLAQKRRYKLVAQCCSDSNVARTLLGFIEEQDVKVELELIPVIWHLQAACKQIAAVLGSPSGLSAAAHKVEAHFKALGSSHSGDIQNPLDVVSNNILKSALKSSGKVAVVASEEDNLPVWLNDTGPYVVVFDPLDGSRNIDASIPTGTIFGIYKRLVEADSLAIDHKSSLNVLQRGSRQIAAGYAIYSSATVLCLTFGFGTHGFTLDRSSGEFLVTHPNICIPPRGQIYCVNDARYFDWPEGLRSYIDNIRQGKGQHPKKYSARYICSLVADLHRTMLYGGIAMNPRDHLRLVYEANPLSFLVEQANGKGSDGKRRILDIQPVGIHQRLPLFLGSMDDVLELESYGDVQQLINPGYEL